MDILETVQRKATHINTLEELHKRLKSGKQLRVKYGIDPTNPNIHLGHTVSLRLLKQFQNAGHKAIIILGDFTASLGDPTGRDHMRDGMGLTQARGNAVKYIAQLRKLIDTDHGKCEMHYNSGWLEHYRTGEWIDRMKHWTIQQIIDRDDFKKRISNGDGVHLNELMYPLFQGEDSVRIHADIELGGTEQLFTLMVGREMQKQAGQEPQVCITLPILRGMDGVRRMGKSMENFVGVNEDPFEMFSKIMSIPDDLICEWTNLLTDWPYQPWGVGSLHELITGETPRSHMEDKKQLAKDIVTWLHDEEAADKAAEKWHKQFTLRECPEDIPVCTVQGFTERALFLLISEMGLTASKNKARTMIEQGAVTVNGAKVTEPTQIVGVTFNPVIKCGRKFVRVKYVCGTAE